MSEFEFYASVDELSPDNLQQIIDDDINKSFHSSPQWSVKKLILELKQKGIKSYIVGGAVRDWLNGKSSRDIDISVDCNAEQALALLKVNFDKHIPIDAQMHFGHICIEGDIASIDVNVLRDSADITRGFYTSTFKGGASLIEDANTRDFSFNSFYYDPQANSIFSPFGCAYDDLMKKQINIVSDPKTLAADFCLCIRIILFMSRGYIANGYVLSLLEHKLEKDILEYAEFGIWLKHFCPTDPAQYKIFKNLLLTHIHSRPAIDKVNSWLGLQA